MASIIENHDTFEKNLIKSHFDQIVAIPNTKKKFLLFSGVAFNVPSQCFFSEALTSPYKKTRYKKILQQFQINCFYAHHLKKSRIFEILFLTGDINISVLRCVVSELHFQQLWWNIRYIFIEKKLLKFNVAKY